MLQPLLIFLVCLFIFPHGLLCQTATDQKLEDAVASLRKVSREGLSEEQKEARAKQIGDSWKYLISSGTKGASRLKQEIEKVNASNERDDFFKLSATVVLWNIGKANEADYVASVWSSTPVSAQYTYVFLTAFEAAQTQDPRVLPLLRATLKDDKGSMYVGLHAMNIAWPLSHEFIWGAYGPKGLPVLSEILEKSSDVVEIRSAIVLLTRAQYLPALPRIRQLASSENEHVRRQAIQSLGIFGHPADYDRLITGLNSNDTKELFSYAFALYEFDDERAVRHLIPLLEKNDDELRVEVSLALLRLLTPESLAAVKGFVSKTTNAEMKNSLSRRITFQEDKLQGFRSKAKGRTSRGSFKGKKCRSNVCSER